MANVGLRKPFFAKYTDDNSYGTVKTIAKAISVQITPNFAEGSLYADDGLDEYEKEFKDADITLGTNTVPISVAVEMFGHYQDDFTSLQYNKDDDAPYVGFSIIGVERIKGKRVFTAMFMPKVKFAEPAENYTTKGDSITFGTPSISGKALPNDAGVWRTKAQFPTEAAAIAWLATQYHVAEGDTIPKDD